MRRPLDFTAAMRADYGDVVAVLTLAGPLTMIFHPDGVRHVLQERHLNYDKNEPDDHVLGSLLGKGLLRRLSIATGSLGSGRS
jgi:enediyne biosynthesis protein E7